MTDIKKIVKDEPEFPTVIATEGASITFRGNHFRAIWVGMWVWAIDALENTKCADRRHRQADQAEKMIIYREG